MADPSDNGESKHIDTLIKLIGAFTMLLTAVTGGTWAGVKLGIGAVETSAAVDRRRIDSLETKVEAQGVQLTRIETAVGATNSSLTTLANVMDSMKKFMINTTPTTLKGKPDAPDLGSGGALGRIGDASIR